jgi:outer membrane immunogenic protein
MKKILGGLVVSALLAAPAMAADMRMPVKAAPAPIVTMYSWTGCYIGGHAGYAWGKKKVYDDGGFAIDDYHHDMDGFIAGGQIGCNLWQSDRWVFGIEGQASWADLDGERTIGATGGPNGWRSEADIIGSIAARFGYAFGQTGQTLVFVKGGAAFIHEQYTWVWAPETLNRHSDEHLRWGWMVGGGFEHAIGGGWSFKAEYNYNHFGKNDHNLCFLADCDLFEVKQHVHLVKFGINYKFGGWGSPVVARY